MYKWCWITSSDFYRHYSHLRSIFRFQRFSCLICLCVVYVRYFVTNNVFFRNIFVFSIPWLGLAKLKNWTVNKLNFLVKHICVSLSEQVESVTHFSTSYNVCLYLSPPRNDINWAITVKTYCAFLAINSKHIYKVCFKDFW